MPADLVATLRDADAALHLAAPGELLLVAVSGGPDSVALLHALWRYGAERELALHVAHLDHLLRPESVEDAAYVAHLATAWGLPATLAARDVGSLAREQGWSLETAARRARYAFLATVARDTGARTVAVAHTADDQAETVLMNLVRGTGLAGLRGMLPLAPFPLSAAEVAELEPGLAREGGPLPRLVRPFLGLPRGDLVAYLHAHSLTARTDATNADPRFLRNRVRHEALPALEALNPRLRAALLRLAASAGDDLDYLEAAVDALWPGVVRELEDELAVDRAAWQALAPALQRRLLRRMVERLGGPGREFGAEAVEAARAGLAAGWTFRRSLPGHLRLVADGAGFRLGRQRPALPPLRLGDALQPLAASGATELPGGWTIHRAERPRAPGDGPTASRWACLLDADLAPDLAVRGRRPGDRIRPLGWQGRSRSVQDLFVDGRVPAAERETWPLVVGGGELLWIPGLRVAEAARLGPATRQVVQLLARPPERLADWP